MYVCFCLTVSWCGLLSAAIIFYADLSRRMTPASLPTSCGCGLEHLANRRSDLVYSTGWVLTPCPRLRRCVSGHSSFR